MIVLFRVITLAKMNVDLVLEVNILSVIICFKR